jgi:hypothetical protein
VTAVNQHHGQVADHAARIVAASALLDWREPLRQRPGQTQLVGYFGQQCGPGMGHQSGFVRRDLYVY